MEAEFAKRAIATGKLSFNFRHYFCAALIGCHADAEFEQLWCNGELSSWALISLAVSLAGFPSTRGAQVRPPGMAKFVPIFLNVEMNLRVSTGCLRGSRPT